MHIHHQPMSLVPTDIRTPVPVAAQQAAETRRRLLRAGTGVSDESNPFQSFLLGDTPEEAPHGQRNRQDDAEEEERPGRRVSLTA